MEVCNENREPGRRSTGVWRFFFLFVCLFFGGKFGGAAGSRLMHTGSEICISGKFSSGSLNLEPAVSVFCSKLRRSSRHVETLFKAASLLSQLLIDVQRRPFFFFQCRTASTKMGTCLRRSTRRSVMLLVCRSFCGSAEVLIIYYFTVQFNAK